MDPSSEVLSDIYEKSLESRWVFDEVTNPQVRLTTLNASQKSRRILVEETRNNMNSIIARVRRIDLWELNAIQHLDYGAKTGHVEVAGRRVHWFIIPIEALCGINEMKL